MTEEVRDYAEKIIRASNIRMVPGHYPDFDSKEHVDQWLKICRYCFDHRDELIDFWSITQVNEEDYERLLNQLRKNRENISLEILQTKYKISYRKLEEDIKSMTERILQDVVFHGFLIERAHAEETHKAINQAIKASGLLNKISHAAYQHYSACKVMEYAEELRDIVHRAEREAREVYKRGGEVVGTI